MKIKSIESSLLMAALALISPVAVSSLETKTEDVIENQTMLTPSQFSVKTIQSFFGRQEKGELESQEEKNFSDSMANYVKEHYNSPDYSEFISQNCDDLLRLLEVIAQTDMPNKPVHSYTSLKLFHDKWKSVELIDASVPLELMQKLPDLLSQQLKEQEESPSLELLKDNIESLLLTQLVENFSEFAEKPQDCISKISTNLAAKQLEYLENIENREKLRSIIVRMIEGVLSKCIWSKTDFENNWHSVLSIADQIQALQKNKIIIDEDDIDSLLWSLLHRFCFYLSLTGGSLPMNFYEEIEDDVLGNVVPFLEAEEQDECIKTKKETLIEALIKAKAKAIAIKI